MITIKLTAEQVKKLPEGTRVVLITKDRFGFAEKVLGTVEKVNKSVKFVTANGSKTITKDMEFEMDRIEWENVK